MQTLPLAPSVGVGEARMIDSGSLGLLHDLDLLSASSRLAGLVERVTSRRPSVRSWTLGVGGGGYGRGPADLGGGGLTGRAWPWEPLRGRLLPWPPPSSPPICFSPRACFFAYFRLALSRPMAVTIGGPAPRPCRSPSLGVLLQHSFTSAGTVRMLTIRSLVAHVTSSTAGTAIARSLPRFGIACSSGSNFSRQVTIGRKS